MDTISPIRAAVTIVSGFSPATPVEVVELTGNRGDQVSLLFPNAPNCARDVSSVFAVHHMSDDPHRSARLRLLDLALDVAETPNRSTLDALIHYALSLDQDCCDRCGGLIQSPDSLNGRDLFCTDCNAELAREWQQAHDEAIDELADHQMQLQRERV